MTAVRVYVATTDGPSEVQRIAEEDPEVRSVVCLNGTSEALPISAAYDAFVRKPTGIIERLFGHPVFRMDVAGRISDGRSWQLGAFAAHALRAAGRLAQRGAPAARAVWLTGTVDSDLKVGPVDHIAEKLQRSQPLFDQLRAEGVPVTVFLPKASADQLPSSESFGGAGIGIVAVEDTDALCRSLGLPRVARGAVTVRSSARRGKRRALVAAAVVVVAAGAAGAVQMRNEIAPWLASLWPAATSDGNGKPPVADGGQTAGTTAVTPPAEPAPPAVTPAVVVTPAAPPEAKPEAPSTAGPAPASPPTVSTPEPVPAPDLSAADIPVSAVEWRAPGGRSCAVAGFGTAGPTEVPIGAATSGRFAVSSANGLCAVTYTVANTFAEPLHVWLYAAPMGVRKHFGATASALQSRVLKPGEALDVELKLPRWVNEPVSHRVFVVAAKADAGSFGWLDEGMAAIDASFDFAQWSALRTRIQKDGLTLVSLVHEIVP